MRGRQRYAIAITMTGALLAIPIIGTGIWLASDLDNDCVLFMQRPVFSVGGLLLVAGLAGVVGASWRIDWLTRLYVSVLLLLVIILLLAFVIFTSVVSNNSRWLHHKLRGRTKWARITNCFDSVGICLHMNHTYISSQSFFSAHISPLQSGCCKPASKCGYKFVSPTYWVNPNNTSADPDCSKWSNNRTQLCYSCNSCKEGLIANLMRKWRKANVSFIISLVAIMLVYLIGCLWLVYDIKYLSKAEHTMSS